MVVTNLYRSISVTLANANEIWVAVALANDGGFELLQEAVPENIIQHYLVGINLPTTVSVLKTLQSRLQPNLFEAKIYNPASDIFHPKLYLIRSTDQYKAFVGSANLTDPGLRGNIELCIEINDQDACQQLLKWFMQHYHEAYPLFDENIKEYQEAMVFNNLPEEGMSYGKKLKLKRQQPYSKLNDINFTDRYFKHVHHLAFRGENWTDTSDIANTERGYAAKRFRELHEEIYPRFEEFNLSNFHPNTPNHLISKSRHYPDRLNEQINAMWLSYGKSQQEIIRYHEKLDKDWRKKKQEDDRQSFINHARLQIRIEYSRKIGIWILFGKDNGSVFDRAHFRNQMEREDYRQEFFGQLKLLPEPYWIEVNENKRPITGFLDANQLQGYCSKDISNKYFVIGRDYFITDVEMSENNLPSTTLKEFERLKPIYDLMRHYL